MKRSRVILIADEQRPATAEILNDVRAALDDHVDVYRELAPTHAPIDDIDDVVAAVVVGGDGTLISQAQKLVPHDIPLIGVNTGRLGFLAEFDTQSLREHASVIFSDAPPTQAFTVLSVEAMTPGDTAARSCIAVNDAVITAGPPFHMIEIQLAINGVPGPTLTGDGVIVSTPLGSTAYNISANGPIVHPAVEAMVITPLAAHSLAFRPIVISDDHELTLTIRRGNEGTTLLHDGHPFRSLMVDDCVTIRPHARKVRFVLNPGTTYWHILQNKLRWAVPPNYRGR
ncbi:MAG: NAD(+)/NADH kinase [Planctomycetota bacterium]